MPNRGLKESILTSGSLAELSAEEERFFYRLLVAVDDYGRMDARPAVLRARCFPLLLDRVTDADIGAWLAALGRVELLERYVVDGRPYLILTGWGRHQQTRAKRSKYPAPPTNRGNEGDTTSSLISPSERHHTSTSNEGGNLPQIGEKMHMRADANICEQMRAEVPETRDTRHESAHARTRSHTLGKAVASDRTNPTVPAEPESPAPGTWGRSLHRTAIPAELDPAILAEPEVAEAFRAAGCADPGLALQHWHRKRLATRLDQRTHRTDWVQDLLAWLCDHGRLGCPCQKAKAKPENKAPPVRDFTNWTPEMWAKHHRGEPVS